MVKQDKGLKRDTIDKFYTKDFIVDLCIANINKELRINKIKDTVIEPSAGNGSFINSIKSICDNTIFCDLEPENSQIIKQDYFLFDYTKLNGDIHVIGNPPFGRQSSTALKFIKFSSKFCKSISFILPKSFKKQSVKSKIPLNFHCISEIDLPENSFSINNTDYNVPCVFQIWLKKDYERCIPSKITPVFYKFVKKEEPHDISFRRVGINAGCVSKETSDKNKQSHYFIKFTNGVFNNELFEKLKSIKFECKNFTVGPKSISKQELNRAFKEFF